MANDAPQAAQFEALASRVLAVQYAVAFSAGSVPGVRKRFEFVSPDTQIVGDAKYFSRAGGVGLPPATFSIIAEHVWLLDKTNAASTFLVLGGDREVPIRWLERYSELASAVTFFFLPDSEALEQSIHTWVLGLADSEKAELLVRLVADDDPHHLHSELVQRAQQETGSKAGHVFGLGRGGRTVQQLLAGAAQRKEARRRAATERAEQERQRQNCEQATARAAYLDSLIGRVDEEWQRVEALVATRRPTDYDGAVQVLGDLAARGGRFDSFVARFEQLRARHARKVSLLERFENAWLLSEQRAASGRGAREV